MCNNRCSETRCGKNWRLSMSKKVVFLMHERKPTGEYSPAIVNWYGILERFGYDVYYEDYRQYDPEKFYIQMKEFKPDYIFHPTYDKIHTEFHRLREFSKVYVIHSDDDWRYDNFAKYWIPFTDGAIGYQHNKEAYLGDGASDNYYMRARYTFNPNTMYFDFSDDRIYDTTHIGNFHGGKKEKINKLISNNISVKTISNLDTYPEYLKSYKKSKMSLCFTNNSLGTALQSKTRLAEMPYYCVLASEPWPQMEMWNMEPNKDFVLLDFSNTEYIEIVDKILNDSKAYEEMYTSARRITVNKNTVFHEWNVIMTDIDEDFKKHDVSKIIDSFGIVL